jgi:hypothetical protein
MTELLEDPWVKFGVTMVHDFSKYHQKTMPENFENVWDVAEIFYFCFAFVLWAAQTKFTSVKSEDLVNRAHRYRMCLSVTMDAIMDAIDDSKELFDYDVYVVRELEYFTEFNQASRSLFRVVSLSALKPGCKFMVSKTCKRPIFSQKELVKRVNYWLTDKMLEFDRTVDFS